LYPKKEKKGRCYGKTIHDFQKRKAIHQKSIDGQHKNCALLDVYISIDFKGEKKLEQLGPSKFKELQRRSLFKSITVFG